jgi:hypothetical protein
MKCLWLNHGIPWHSTEGAEERCEELSEDSQCSGQDSNCASPKLKTNALPLHQVTGSMVSSLWKEVVLV